MTKTDWTAAEVRSAIAHMRVASPDELQVEHMLTAFAERIEADESAVPFAWCRAEDLPRMDKIRKSRTAGGALGLYVTSTHDEDHTVAVYVIHPPAQPAQEQPGWSREAPTESGWYWHWDGECHRINFVFTRPGHAYLCTEGEPYGPGQKRNFQAVLKMGGWWKLVPNPTPPKEK